MEDDVHIDSQLEGQGEEQVKLMIILGFLLFVVSTAMVITVAVLGYRKQSSEKIVETVKQPVEETTSLPSPTQESFVVESNSGFFEITHTPEP